MKKAIIHCRVANKQQINESSVEIQKKLCKNYARKNGFEVIDTISNKANTKPSIEKLLSSIKAKKVNYVIAERPDRISRDFKLYYWIKGQLEKLNVKLRFANEDVDESPAGVLVEGILKAMNKFDSEWRSRRIKEGIKQAKLRKQA